MFCTKCGASLAETAKFCSECGALVEKTAAESKGISIKSGSRLVPVKCTNCGGYLEISRNLKVAKCGFCNNEFLIEHAVKNYNVSVNGQDMTVVLADGQRFLLQGAWLMAYDKFTQVLMGNPESERAQAGVVEALQGLAKQLEKDCLDFEDAVLVNQKILLLGYPLYLNTATREILRLKNRIERFSYLDEYIGDLGVLINHERFIIVKNEQSAYFDIKNIGSIKVKKNLLTDSFLEFAYNADLSLDNNEVVGQNLLYKGLVEGQHLFELNVPKESILEQIKNIITDVQQNLIKRSGSFSLDTKAIGFLAAIKDSVKAEQDYLESLMTDMHSVEYFNVPCNENGALRLTDELLIYSSNDGRQEECWELAQIQHIDSTVGGLRFEFRDQKVTYYLGSSYAKDIVEIVNSAVRGEFRHYKLSQEQIQAEKDRQNSLLKSSNIAKAGVATALVVTGTGLIPAVAIGGFGYCIAKKLFGEEKVNNAKTVGEEGIYKIKQHISDEDIAKAKELGQASLDKVKNIVGDENLDKAKNVGNNILNKAKDLAADESVSKAKEGASKVVGFFKRKFF